MLNKLTLYSPMKGPSSVEGCACQNLVLWIVSWCTRAAWVLSGLCSVFIQKRESSSCAWLLSLLWASFLREGPSKLCVSEAKTRWDPSALCFLWPQSRRRLCPAGDWAGHEAGLEGFSRGNWAWPASCPCEVSLAWGDQHLRAGECKIWGSIFPPSCF